MIRYLNLILCLLVLSGCDKDDIRALRVDLNFSGYLDSCVVDVVGLYSMSDWSGAVSCGEKDETMGNFVYSLYCKKEGRDTLIYREGFSSLYYEWATMEYEGKDRGMVFEHTLLVPYVDEDLRLVIECRKGKEDSVVYDGILDMRNVRKKKYDEVEMRYLHKAQESKSRTLDVAILAEGYMSEDSDLFWSDAKMLAEGLMSEFAYMKYSDRIHVRGFFKASATSGASDPSVGYKADNVLGSSFGVFGSDRYLETFETFAVYDYVGEYSADVFIVLVNSEKYGGGGVYNCFAIGSVESEDWVEVMMHELGHSFAGLADEYYYEGETSPDMYSMDVEPWEPNITTLVDFDKKWKRLYDSKEVGLIEGAAYNAKGLYRSESNCKMRELHIPFCRVCNDAIENRIKRYIE